MLVIRDDEKVAIHKRSASGLLAGLYELPNLPGHMDTEAVLSYIRELGYAPIRITPLADAKHIFSHVEWRMKGYVVSIEEPGNEISDEDARYYKEQRKKKKLVFVDAADAKERYAIPAAFAAYAGYMNIRLGKEAFDKKEETGA